MKLSNTSIERFIKYSSLRNIIFLYTAILGVSACLIPISPFLIDYLIVLSTLYGAMFLCIAAILSIGTTQTLLAFPIFIVITSIYRILISGIIAGQALLHANAGEIVFQNAFYFVKDSFTLGLYYFLLIILVQAAIVFSANSFILKIPAKGTYGSTLAESKLIDRFFHAMQYALKFVLCEVVMRFVTAALTLLVGMWIGINHLQMPIGDAFRTFSLLSIGTGVVFQYTMIFVPILAVGVTALIAKLKKNSSKLVT